MDLLKEIPEKELPEEFERELSFRLSQEAGRLKTRRRNRFVAVAVASFLVVFGSVSVYNNLGKFMMGGGSADSAVMEMAMDGALEEAFDGAYGNRNKNLSPDGEADIAAADKGAGTFQDDESNYLAMISEYLGSADYAVDYSYLEENGDWIFHIIYEGREIVFIGRSGEIHEQEGEEQQADSD